MSFLIIPGRVSAQLELYVKADKTGKVQPIINYNGSKHINEKISLIFFSLVRENWSQALIGISYSPNKIVTIAGSAGIEHGKSHPRYSASVALKKDQNSLLVLGELGSGKDNYLYKINAFHQVNDQITFGLTAWRYHGLGPNFRYSIPKVGSTVWLMPAYDLDTKQSRVILGVNFKM